MQLHHYFQSLKKRIIATSFHHINIKKYILNCTINIYCYSSDKKTGVKTVKLQSKHIYYNHQS